MKPSTLRAIAANRRTLLRGMTEETIGRLIPHFPAALSPGHGTVLEAGGGWKRSSVLPLLLSPRHRAHLIHLNLDGGSEPEVIADLTRPWPCRPGGADLIVSTWVLEHLGDPGAFVDEAHLALRPGGALLLTAPFIYFKHGAPTDYYRFTDEALRRLVERAGFQIEALRPVGGGPFLAALSLLWPLARFIPVLPIAGAAAGDRLVTWITRLARRGEWMTSAYPLAHVVVAVKKVQPPGGLDSPELSRSRLVPG